MKQKLLVFAGCVLLLLPSTLPAKSPKGQHPDHVEPKELVDQAKKELLKEIQALRQEVGKVRNEVNVVRQEVQDVSSSLIRAHAFSFLKDKTATVKDKDPIPFTSNELRDSPIICHDGAFILPYAGTYIVNFGVITKGAAQPHFELQQEDKSVPGGTLFAVVYENTYGIGSLSVMISANAQDKLKIVNVTGDKVTFSDKSPAPAYITILHVQQ